MYENKLQHKFEKKVCGKKHDFDYAFVEQKCRFCCLIFSIKNSLFCMMIFKLTGRKSLPNSKLEKQEKANMNKSMIKARIIKTCDIYQTVLYPKIHSEIEFHIL